MIPQILVSNIGNGDPMFDHNAPDFTQVLVWKGNELIGHFKGMSAKRDAAFFAQRQREKLEAEIFA